MSWRAIRFGVSRLIALIGIAFGVLPFVPLAGISIPYVLPIQNLICMICAVVLGLIAVRLDCRWGWLAVGLAILNFGWDIVIFILMAAQDIQT